MITLLTGSWRRPPKCLGVDRSTGRDFRDANAARSKSFDKAPRELEQEGAREALPAPPLPIDDPEVQKKIRAISKEEPMVFIARTGISVAQIKVLSIDQIRRFI